MLSILLITDGLSTSTQLIAIDPFNKLVEEEYATYDKIFVKEFIKNYNTLDYKKYDLIFMVRVCGDEVTNILINHVIPQNNNVIFAIDDDFISITNGNSENLDKTIVDFIQTLNPEKNIPIICKNVKQVITYSMSTYKRLSEFTDNIYLIHGLVDITYITNIKANLKPKTDNIITIGYAGVDYHFNNIKSILKDLRRILIDYSDTVKFEFFFKECPAELIGLPNVIHLNEISPINSYYEFMLNRYWDIGLSPLTDNEFNKSKTNNKYREYAALGIAGIYSDIETYNKYVTHKKTGLLEKYNWYYAIQQLINDPILRKNICLNAYDDVKHKFSIENSILIYKEIFNRVTSNE